MNFRRQPKTCGCTPRKICLTLIGGYLLFVFIVYLSIFKFGGGTKEQVIINEYNLSLNHLPSVTNLKIAHITDLHYRGTQRPGGVSDQMLLDSIEAINAANVDFIFATGDFVDIYPSEMENLTKNFLSKLKSKNENIVVLGNHDYQHSYSKSIILRHLEQIGWKVLINQIYYPEYKEQRPIQILGLGDLWEEYGPNVISKIQDGPQNVLRVVLTHNPDSAVDLQGQNIDLILTGHTHGAQYCLPFGIRQLIPYAAGLPTFFRNFIPSSTLLDVVKHWEWTKGWTIFEQDGKQTLMYTNTGLTKSPVRIWCKSELIIVTINKKD